MTCNPFRPASVQRPNQPPLRSVRTAARAARPARLIGLVGLLAFGALSTGPAGAGSSAPAAGGGLARAESAVRMMEQGDLRGAALVARQALDADPGNALLHNVAASLLQMTGDTDGAVSEWTASLADMPDDSLALYGLGLASVVKGDQARALDRLQLAERTGDRTCCMLAERYLEAINGAAGAGVGLAVPDRLAASAKALSGMAAARAGDNRRAVADLTAALAAMPGDPYSEPAGLVMTFSKEAPLRAAPRLPLGNGLAVARGGRKDKPLSGTVSLTPDGADAYTGFVAYKIDGATSSIVNTSPFTLVWNTAAVPNGTHVLEVTIYDKQGQECGHARKQVRTANSNAPRRPGDDPAREARVRQALWQMLTLQPSRHVLAYTAAESARASGDNQTAERMYELAAALAPDYGDTRARVTSLSACSAGPALWRGAPTDNVVALTFDDGPKPGVTDMLLNVLKQQGVPGTFFVIGRHATEYPALTRKIAEAGMQIEDHTYTHPNLTLLPPAAVERELLRTVASVRAATGRRMRYFRPPGGNISAEVTRIAAEWGLTPVMWTVDGEALENGTSGALVKYVLDHTHGGAIILLHNGRMTTVDALPKIIAGLRKRGFGFVTIDQLAQRRGQLAAAPAAAAPGIKRPQQ